MCHLFLRGNPRAIVRSALCRPSDGQVGAFVHQPDISVGGNDPISGGRGKSRPSEPALWMKSRNTGKSIRFSQFSIFSKVNKSKQDWRLRWRLFGAARLRVQYAIIGFFNAALCAGVGAIFVGLKRGPSSA